MKASELDESFRYTTKGGNRIYFYGTKNSKIPTIIVINNDKQSEMSESNSYTIVTIKSRTIEKRSTDLYRDKLLGQQKENLTDDEKKFIVAYNAVRKGNVDDIEALNKIGKVREINDRATFYKFITTDLKMPLQVFEKYFGSPPELKDEFIKFRDARVFFPDNIRASNKKTMLGLIAKLDDLLSAKKLDYLIHGDIRFVRLGGNIAGNYSSKSKDMRISPNAKKTKRVVFTIIHEFGHKLHYEYLENKSIEDKYNELRSEGFKYNSYTEQDSEIEQIKQQIKPGMSLNYKGRKKRFKRPSGYIITAVEGDRFQAAASERPHENIMSGKLSSIINNRWEIENVNNIVSEKSYEETGAWFPSKYSQKDYIEWFAELFAYYVLDLLTGPPAKWMESMT